MAPNNSCLPISHKRTSKTFSGHQFQSPAPAGKTVATAGDQVPGFAALKSPYIRTWGGKTFRGYRGLDQDEDMWALEGGVVVYFSDGVNILDPKPAFRLNAQTIEKSGLPFLCTLLKQGRNTNLPEIFPERKPADALLGRENSAKRHSTAFLPLPKSVSPLKFPQFDLVPQGQGDESKRHSWNNTTADRLNVESESYDFASGESLVTHELYFIIPGEYSGEKRFGYKLAVRNILALLQDKAIVGRDFYQMVREVQALLETYKGYDDDDAAADPVSLLKSYLQAKNLLDVRYDLTHAMGLLAWCERSSVQWPQVYMEAFVHAVGMMTYADLMSPEFRRLSPNTQFHLGNAFQTLELKLVEAEERFLEFNFDRMWDILNLGEAPARKSYDSFRQYLIEFFKGRYKQWPPKAKGRHWMTRSVIKQLQEDFGILYSHLVDKDIHWTRLHARYRREWEMESRVKGNDAFQADLPTLPVTDMITRFDNYHKFQHLPCPYPLLPRTSPITEAPKKLSRTRRLLAKFETSRKKNSRVKSQKTKNSIAMRAAANYDIVRKSERALEVVGAFQIYETEFVVEGVPMRDARVGRWLVIYGALQVLSLLSVDVGGLRFTDKVEYPLCGNLAGLPPWKPEHKILQPAQQDRSYCWTVLNEWESSAAQQPVNIPDVLQQKPLPATPRTRPAEHGQAVHRKACDTLPLNLQEAPLLKPTTLSLAVDTDPARPAKQTAQQPTLTGADSPAMSKISSPTGSNTLDSAMSGKSAHRDTESTSPSTAYGTTLVPQTLSGSSTPNFSRLHIGKKASNDISAQSYQHEGSPTRVGASSPAQSGRNTTPSPQPRAQLRPSASRREAHEDAWFLNHRPRSGRRGFSIPSYYEQRDTTHEAALARVSEDAGDEVQWYSKG